MPTIDATAHITTKDKIKYAALVIASLYLLIGVDRKLAMLPVSTFWAIILFATRIE